MTIGIYALYWEEPDLVYIGQSKDIEARFYEHERLLKVGKHPNYKVNRAYNNYGLPEFFIIEKCGLNELNNLEIKWMEEFSSLENGLNITPGGITTGKDTEHGAAKYTKNQIREAVEYLLQPEFRLKEISEVLKISTAVLSTIQNMSRHRWILEEDPTLELKLKESSLKRREARRVKSKHEGKQLINCKTNEIVTIQNIAQFCREHLLKSEPRINEVLSEKRRSYKDWSLLKE